MHYAGSGLGHGCGAASCCHQSAWQWRQRRFSSQRWPRFWVSGSARRNLAGGSHAGTAAAFGAITPRPESPCGFVTYRQSVGSHAPGANRAFEVRLCRTIATGQVIELRGETQETAPHRAASASRRPASRGDLLRHEKATRYRSSSALTGGMAPRLPQPGGVVRLATQLGQGTVDRHVVAPRELVAQRERTRLELLFVHVVFSDARLLP